MMVRKIVLRWTESRGWVGLVWAYFELCQRDYTIMIDISGFKKLTYVIIKRRDCENVRVKEQR